MAWSPKMAALDWRQKAINVHYLLHGPFIDIKDAFVFVLGGAVVTPVTNNMSEEAWKLWSKNCPKDITSVGPKIVHRSGTIIEHVVPVDVLYKWLIKSKERLSILDIENALKLCPIAIISKDEDVLLRNAKLSKSMPDNDYDVLTGDPWSRYKVVGIKMHTF